MIMILITRGGNRNEGGDTSNKIKITIVVLKMLIAVFYLLYFGSI